MKARESWIDVLRGIAIIFVLIDHGFVYFSQMRLDWIGWNTFVAVTWFIFLAGVTNTISFQKKQGSKIKVQVSYYLSKLNIITAYFFAALWYGVYDFLSGRPLSEILNRTLTFSGAPHFYFIEVILALYLLFPLLFVLVRRLSTLFPQVTFLFLVGLLTYKLVPLAAPPWFRTEPLFVIARAYIFPFSAGIVYWHWWKDKKVVHLLAGVVAIILEVYLLSENGIFAVSTPNVLLALFAVCSCISLGVLVKRYLPDKSRLTQSFTFLGRHSLFIYLLHFMFLDIFVKIIAPRLNFFTFIAAIYFSAVVSLLGEKLYRMLVNLKSLAFSNAKL